MARIATLVTFITAAASVSAGPIAGPACAYTYRGQPDCVEKCKSNWGFNGGTLGADRWGPVVVPSSVVSGLDAYVAKACGSSAAAVPTSTKPALSIEIPKNVGGIPPTYSQSQASLTSSAVVTSSSTVAPTTTLVVTSSSSSTTPSSSAAPTSSSAPNLQPPTTSQVPPTTSSSVPQPPRTTSTQAPAPPSTRAPPPQPTPTPPSGGSGGSGGARQEWLDAHNAVRARHGANPLTWGDDLEAAALRWAQGCVWKHSQGAVGSFGENLAAGTGSYSATSALNGWAAEVSQYNPSNPVFSHFTQVVWKSTTRVGCATVVCNNNMIPSFGNTPTTYHVCEYDPPGNFIGQFAENVQV